MDADRIDEMTGWESRAFDGGHTGLRDLADQEFTGSVTNGNVWLVFVSGRVVGVFDGSIDGFEDSSGTAYSAPDPSLPLLFAMQEIGGNVRAQYYTNDTPVSEADGTLQSGNFTGYVELSENVLSGDYYVVYHQGKSLATAFVGNNRQLKTGDEAFDLANEEVGIYKVYDVDLEVYEIPDSGSDVEAETDPEPESQQETESDSEPESQQETESDPGPESEQEAEPGIKAESQVEPERESTQESESEIETESESGSEENTEPSASDPDGTLSQEPDQEPNSTTERRSDDLESGVLADIAGSFEDTDRDADNPDDTTEKEVSAADALSSPSDNVSQAAVSEDSDTSSREPEETAVDAHSDEAFPEEQESGVEAVDTDSAQVRDEDTPPQDTSGIETDGAAQSEVSTQPDEADLRESVAGNVAEPAVSSESDEVENEPDLPDDGSASSQASDVSQEQTKVEDAGQEPSSATIHEDTRADNREEGVPTEGAEWPKAQSTPQSDFDSSSSSGDESPVDPSDDEPSPAEAPPETEATSSSNATSLPPEEKQEGQLDTASESADDRQQSSESSADESAENHTSEQEERLRRRIDRLELAVDEAETQREELLDEREQITTERDQYKQTVQNLESELENLEATVDHLEDKLEKTQTQSSEGEQAMSPQEALSGTNFFIRYDTQDDVTLEQARDRDADKDQLQSNLQIEHHTAFKNEGVTVDGVPFEEWLHGSIQYRFTRWLVAELLFEIRETDNAGELSELYDTIPELDRVDINGEAEFVISEDGEEFQESRRFDVIFRDRLGAPLFLAELNDSREPTSELTLQELVTGAKSIRESKPRFVAAFGVTESFFEPGALKTAEEATSGGFFSRGSQRSYVKLSRKQGFHLCLVEARDSGFHLNVPKL